MTLLLKGVGRLAASGPFDPISLGGLQAWFKGEDLGALASSISSWSDVSGNARHATQATGSAQPTVVTGINSLKGASFDAGDTLRTAAFALNQPTTVYVVGIANGSPQYFLDGIGGVGTLSFRRGAGNFQLIAPSIFSGAASDSSPHVHHGVFNTTSSKISIDGGTITTGDAGTNNASGLTLGGDGNAVSTNRLNGQISEVLVYSGAHTDPVATQVINYLRAKYGL